jgi:hypothetical protein
MFTLQCRIWHSAVCYYRLIITNTLAGPSIQIPNIRTLYQRTFIISTGILNATNSDPNVDVFTVVFAFEHQMTGAEFSYI